MTSPFRIVMISMLATVAACRPDAKITPEDDAPYTLDLPAGFPAPPVPSDNALTQARVELGRRLFFEPRLSLGATISCASCHPPGQAFSDTSAFSLGVHGTPGFRNAPTLANVAYHPALFRDGGVPSLELQVLAPIHDPVEMDFDVNQAAQLLAAEEPYSSLSIRAYGRPMDGFVITRAIACFERTLISGRSRWDRFMQGEQTAMSEAELRGWSTFSGPEANCTACHGGFDLSDHGYYNIGQYLDYADPGRERITLAPSDEGKFKVPTLRNITLTAPYMHDGSMATLDEVIEHFRNGGLPHPNRSVLMHPFTLTAQEKADLIAFLGALKDEQFIR